MRSPCVLMGVVAGVVLFAGPALAEAAPGHPLGNFSVNHYDGLRLHADRVEVTAIVDSAEIPTLQDGAAVDANADGSVAAAEASAYAARTCAVLAGQVRAEAAGHRLTWQVGAASLAYRPGAAGMRTSRLSCLLRAPVRIDRPVPFTFTDGYRADRVGWHEITAVGGDGVRIAKSTVPSRSISAELRDYPADLLSSPLDVRSARLTAEPGTGESGAGQRVRAPVPGFMAEWMGSLDRRLALLAGSDRLTVYAGSLAVLLALLLGAAHAALPGHGKTVMAGYLAARRGGTRDAITVGATVTLTHTAGVLVLGLALTLSASLAGESVIAYLGVISGLLVAGIGVWLLVSALWGHQHAHGHGHGHGHGHSGESFGRRGLVGLGVAGGLVPSPSALVVLLGAIALGRTAFGVVLVLCYGLGMAATLTAAGVLLVRVGTRMRAGRLLTHRLRPYTAVAMASLVAIVGLALTARSLGALV